METLNEKIYEEMREILEKNRDAEKGFAKAAENAKNLGLKTYFDKKSAERRAFNGQLISAIQTIYSDFDAEGSFTGTIHRVWMDMKAFISGDNDESMLEESIRGDKAAVEEYTEVLKDNTLPSSIRHLISEQLQKIKIDIAKNQQLEDFL